LVARGYPAGSTGYRQRPAKETRDRTGMKGPGNMSNLLTVPEVARRLRVSNATIYAMTDSGKLKCYRIGNGKGTIRVSEDHLESMLNQRQDTTPVYSQHIR
jgi:excisionase family DNA binding protein